MKNKGIILTAVLLLAVLLFFLKEKNERDKEENPTGTPVPTQNAEEPFVAKNVWIVSSGESSITFYYDGKVQTMATKGKLQETITESVGDVTILGEQVIALVLKPDKIKAKVLLKIKRHFLFAVSKRASRECAQKAKDIFVLYTEGVFLDKG